jgi:hypothetical protein
MAELFDRRLSRRTLLRVGALTAASPLFLRTSRASADVVLGPTRVAFGSDPSSSLAISASLPSEFSSAILRYGPTADLGAQAPLDVTGLPGVATRYGRARLDGLSPGTAFSYQVEVDGVLGPLGQVSTAPTTPGGFTFTAFGDEGTTSVAARLVQRLRTHKPAFHLVSGDLCYADPNGRGQPTDALNSAVWDRWLKLIAPVATSTPWMTAVGNHEMEPALGPQGYDGYLARLPMPDSGGVACPASYHFRYGSAAFVQMDSNDASYEIPANLDYSGGQQTSWLTDVLGAYRADPTIDFIVVTMHHCAYSTADGHGSEGGIRDRWVPLFDLYGVDLVLSGHNHAYERTHLLRKGRTVVRAPRAATVSSASGTTYLVVGGGGAPLGHGFTPGRTRLSQPNGTSVNVPASFSARTVRANCYVVASVVPGTTTARPRLDILVRDVNGTVIDSVHLRRPLTPITP